MNIDIFSACLSGNRGRDFMGIRKKRILSAILAGACLLTPCVYSVPTASSVTANAADSQKKGQSDDGYDYEIWNVNDEGDTLYENQSENGYRCIWDGIENVLFKKGRDFSETKPSAKDIGDFTVSYDADMQAEGNTFFGVYGWLQDPLVEYYILEGWGNWRPFSDKKDCYVTSYEVDGAEYDLYSCKHYSTGMVDNSFTQYYSIKSDSEIPTGEHINLSGTVNVGDHFREWEKAGLKLGSIYEIMLSTESYKGNGKAVINSLEMSEDIGQSKPKEKLNSLPHKADENGVYARYGFEYDEMEFTADTSENTLLSIANGAYTSGWNSCAVKGSYSSKKELYIDFDKDSFGEYASIGFNAVHNSSDEAEISLEMQVFTEEDNAEPKRHLIDSFEVKGGKWVSVGNDEFAVPQASDVAKYRIIISCDKDFYIDDLQFGEKGCPLPEIAGSVFRYSLNSSSTDWIENDFTDEGYYYEMWNQQGQGSIFYEHNENNGYTFTWGGVDNAFFSKGRKFENKPDANKIKSYNIKYEADVLFCDEEGSADWIGVYGWMEDPMIEYFIVDGWGNWKPLGQSKPIAEFISNGEKYEVYKTSRINQPSISSGKTFEQYWSVRVDNPVTLNEYSSVRNSVNLADHLKAWSAAGMRLGSLYDATVHIECYNSKGDAIVHGLHADEEAELDDSFSPKELSKYDVPDSSGEYYRNAFEDKIRKTAYKTYGKTKLTSETKRFTGGKSSCKVSSDNADENRAFGIGFDKYNFNPFKLFNIGAYVRQDSEENARLSMDLYIYRGEAKEPEILHLADAITEKNRWTAIQSIDVSVPHLDDIQRYELHFSNGDKPFDFLIDDLSIASGNALLPDPITFVPPDVKGDLNRDGQVDVFDIILCRKAITDQLTNEEVRYFADVNGDGDTGVSDLVMLYSFVSGKNNDMEKAE